MRTGGARAEEDDLKMNPICGGLKTGADEAGTSGNLSGVAPGGNP